MSRSATLNPTFSRNPLFAPTMIAAPFASEAKEGHELVNLEELNVFMAIMGSERRSGYHTEGDLVTVTTDGRDLNAMWAEFQVSLQIYQEHRNELVGLLTYPVTNLIEDVPQVSDTTFEEASEFGVPKSARVTLDYFQMAYDFKDYDVALRYTWKFLRDADARQVEAVHQSVLDADNKMVFRKVMEAIFDNRNRTADIRNQNYNVYALYNADTTVPPTYADEVFDATHNHYLVSNAVQIDSDDLDDAYEHIAEHGYSIENGTTVIHMLNKAQAKEVRKFRAGVANNNSAIADYDFIPAANQPTLIVPNSEGLLGDRPPSSWNGLPVFGSYGGRLLIEEQYIPESYMLTFGTGGAGDLQNLVGLREHANEAYRGLRLLPGNQQRYPLVDAYYSRGFGTGIRQRGGGVVTQFKVGAADSYVPPAKYTRGGGLV